MTLENIRIKVSNNLPEKFRRKDLEGSIKIDQEAEEIIENVERNQRETTRKGGEIVVD